MLSNFTIHWGIAPGMYRHIYYILISIFALSFARYTYVTGNNNLLKKQSQVPMSLFVTFMILFIGFRTVNSGDMGSYRGWYIRRMFSDTGFSLHSEWLWDTLARICRNAGFSEWIWFAIITLGYIGCMFWTCKRLLFENVSLAMLFMFSSFSFFAYGTNTLRNGLACSIVLLAISFFAEFKKRGIWIGSGLILMAFGFHRSIIIPATAIYLSLFVFKKIKYSIYAWITSILLSLAAGSSLMSLFSRFDDTRVESYFYKSKDAALFSSTGFRWDFLLYSSIPIIVAWYVCQKRNVEDRVFTFLASVYMLSNAVWVICIRANYSDRFAYLSWFLYPMILAYAFIRIPLFKNQDRAVAWVLYAHVGFTLGMYYILGK